MNAEPINALIAQRVLIARQAAGLSRPQLSGASGIAERTLARRESGRSAWTTDELDAVASALGIELETLVTRRAEAA